MKKPNILDRAVMTMAPVHAAKRAAARVALSVLYQKRVRQLRSQPDEKEHERLDVPRRQRQGGHRGQH
ncbi:MAG: hypothetical protein V8R27_03585 [Oscillospiraceae bacterium]